ncbi:MAG TPA: GNAT family N-acetyltransferase [Saprospiraceae bacterium]|nr:GNAT family N-acetyltransferase [Saprospiraceae bacterium]HMP13121.1 GNAT family N-acetyltransferase [Saprospiraceae bacterium]
MNNPLIRTELQPGDVGAIIWLHGLLYGQERGFDYTFDAFVAEPLAQFIQSITPRECLWIVEHQSTVMGSIAIVKRTDTEAQLRWFLLHPDVRGFGIGRQLMQIAMDFCKLMGYEGIRLWTISEQQTAIRLYQSFGFQKVSSETRHAWGRIVQEEVFLYTM